MAKVNYEASIKQLEEIVRRIESDELNVDSICEELKKAKKLIKLCKEKLYKTEEEINAIISEDNN